MKNLHRLVAVTLISTVTVFASPVVGQAEKKVEDVQKKRESVKKEINQAEKDIKKLASEVSELKLEIAEYEDTLKQNEQATEEVKAEIAEVEAEIVELEKLIKHRFDILKERAQSYQSNGGNINYLEVVFGAKDFQDFISRISVVNKIASSDADLIKQLEKDKAKVEENLQELAELKKELDQIQENMEIQLELTEEKQASLKKKEAKLKESVEKLKKEDKDLAIKEADLYAESKGVKFSHDTANSSATLGWPTDGGYVSSHLGPRWGRMHNGIDIARTNRSTSPPIYAAESGTVEVATFNNGGYGNMVIINHGNGLKTTYAHMSSMKVKSGDTVKRGEQIGVMGATGNSTGIHLHFEVHVNGAVKNPLVFLR